MLEIFIQGFLLQGSLILALGAQNLFIIDVGLKRNHHLLAATICALSDVLLIMLGVLGVSVLLVQTVYFKVSIGFIGAAFLLSYAIVKLRDFYLGIEVRGHKAELPRSVKIVALTALTFTFLNPHVYIDTFFLVGGYSVRFDELHDKLAFGLGAGFFSILWFYFLAIFSAQFSTLLTKEKNLRIISLLTGLLLSYLAFRLGTESLLELWK